MGLARGTRSRIRCPQVAAPAQDGSSAGQLVSASRSWPSRPGRPLALLLPVSHSKPRLCGEMGLSSTTDAFLSASGPYIMLYLAAARSSFCFVSFSMCGLPDSIEFLGPFNGILHSPHPPPTAFTAVFLFNEDATASGCPTWSCLCVFAFPRCLVYLFFFSVVVVLDEVKLDFE